MEFSQALRKVLDDRGLTSRDLFAMTGITDSTIRSYLSGERAPSIDRACLIAEKLGVSLDYLCGLTDVQAVDPDLQAFSNKTGLSEELIDYLIETQSTPRWYCIAKAISFTPGELLSKILTPALIDWIMSDFKEALTYLSQAHDAFELAKQLENDESALSQRSMFEKGAYEQLDLACLRLQSASGSFYRQLKALSGYNAEYESRIEEWHKKATEEMRAAIEDSQAQED